MYSEDCPLCGGDMLGNSSHCQCCECVSIYSDISCTLVPTDACLINEEISAEFVAYLPSVSFRFIDWASDYDEIGLSDKSIDKKYREYQYSIGGGLYKEHIL